MFLFYSVGGKEGIVPCPAGCDQISLAVKTDLEGVMLVGGGFVCGRRKERARYAGRVAGSELGGERFGIILRESKRVEK